MCRLTDIESGIAVLMDSCLNINSKLKPNVFLSNDRFVPVQFYGVTVITQ